MQKLCSTISKNKYTSTLDILEIHRVYNEHTVKINFKSQSQYNIFVNEEDFEKAKAIINDKLWKESEVNYSIYSNDMLIKEYIEGLYNDNDKMKFFEKLLLKRGFTDREIQLLIDGETENGYTLKHVKKSTIIWGFIGTFGGGVLGVAIGAYIYLKKSTHPFTEEEFYAYDAESRKYALFFLIIGLIVSYSSVEIKI